MADIRHRLSTVWGEFLNETSLHGCKNTFAKQHGPLKRTLWFLCFGLMVGTLVYTTVTFYLEYLEFNFVTKTSIRYHPELEFPAVTFCNLCMLDKNKFNRSDIDNFNKSDPLVLEYFELVKQYSPYFNISGTKWEGLRLKETDISRVGFAIDDILIYGDLNLRLLLPDQDFSVSYREHLEKCFTFNWRYSNVTYYNKPLMFHATSQLSIGLDTKHYRCFSRSESSGFRFLLHHPNEPFHFHSPYTLLASGYSYTVKVSKKRFQYLSHPYNSYQGQDCLQEKIHKGFGEHRSPYSYASCVIGCLTIRTQSLCGCVTEFLFHDNSSVFCTVAKRYSCAWKIWYAFLFKYPTDLCDCKRPCSEVKYEYELSSWRNKYVKHPRRKIFLSIFFKDMMVTKITHEPELDFGDIISHLGGYMGFCIGASVLTLIELVEVVLKSLKTIRLYRHCTEKNREETPTNPV